LATGYRCERRLTGERQSHLRSRGVDIGHDLVDQSAMRFLNRASVVGAAQITAEQSESRALPVRVGGSATTACPCCSSGGGHLVNQKKLIRLYREEKLAVRRRGSR
jgi:hypothetical protein